jgi:hypothetical protein
VADAIVLKDEVIAVLARAAGFGANLDQLAALAGVSSATLDRIIQRQPGVRDAIEKGRAEAHQQVMQSLFNQAVSEKNVAATIFYLKTRCRWREADRGNEDGHTDRGARKSVRLNYSLDDEEKERRRGNGVNRLSIAVTLLAGRSHGGITSQDVQEALNTADHIIAVAGANSACAHFWSARMIVDGRCVHCCGRCGEIEETSL